MNANDRTREKLLRIYGAACIYCGHELTVKTTTLDHLIPRSIKKRASGNLRPACLKCNQAKAAMSVAEFRWHVIKVFFHMAINPFWKGAKYGTSLRA